MPSAGRESGDARTTEVACLGYGTPLRDAAPVLRRMLAEHGIAVSDPESGDAEQFRTALHAFGAGVIDLGEFIVNFYRLPPVLNDQGAARRSLNLLLHELDQATTREGRDEIVQRLRDMARAASQEP